MSKVDSESLDHVFGSIEGAEQSVIQHLRTSGLRKASETSLIDEILNIRRERRRIFTDLLTVCDSLRNQSRHLEKQLASSREDNVSLKKAATAHIDELRQTAVRDLKLSTATLKKKYESRLQEVGERLEQVTAGKKEHEERLLQAAAEDLTRIELAKQREMYESKMMKYKQALREIVDREKTTETMVARQAKLYSEVNSEVNALKQALEVEQNNKGQSVRQMNDMHAQLESCMSQLQEERVLSNSLQVELRRRKEKAYMEEKEQADQHARELASIDEKVRQAMSRKDDMIFRLEQRNAQLLEDQKTFQQDLQTVFST